MKRSLLVAACLASSLALAQNAPTSVSFNARLADTAGMPVTGSHALVFALYSSATGGSAVWTENVSSASFSTDGVTFVELGATTPLTPTVFDGSKLYLEVTVDGTVMSPRLGVVSVPYAIRASVAAAVGSLTESNIQRRVTGTCNAGQAIRSIDAAGGVVCESVGGGGGGDITSVTTAAGSGLIGGVATGDANLSLMTCANGEVLKSNGTGWACGSAGTTYTGTAPVTVNGSAIGLMNCAAGEVLKYSGSAWGCAADNGGTAYSAGNGLTLTGSQFSVNFAGTGSANTAARSDHTHGVLYTRWGRNVCPGTAQLVYAGFAGGSAHNHSGSGANTICLASTPVWTTPTGSLMTFNDTNLDNSLIYGTEYQTSGGQIGMDALQDYDAACAVCFQPAASTTFMYPGAATCPAGWTTEYFGYLMSSHYQQAKHDWSCVDSTATANGSSVNNDGHLWYSTEAECGSLPCGAGQYIQNREVVCSVCTR
ncbi:MAG: hypothetical protein U0228_22915 [Myxococcaceae bacterium]